MFLLFSFFYRILTNKKPELLKRNYQWNYIRDSVYSFKKWLGNLRSKINVIKQEAKCLSLHVLILWLLILSWQSSLSYRNQFIDLLWKSMGWFLYDNGLRHERVKIILKKIHFVRPHFYFCSTIEKCYCVHFVIDVHRSY